MPIPPSHNRSSISYYKIIWLAIMSIYELRSQSVMDDVVCISKWVKVKDIDRLLIFNNFYPLIVNKHTGQRVRISLFRLEKKGLLKKSMINGRVATYTPKKGYNGLKVNHSFFYKHIIEPEDETIPINNTNYFEKLKAIIDEVNKECMQDEYFKELIEDATIDMWKTKTKRYSAIRIYKNKVLLQLYRTIKS